MDSSKISRLAEGVRNALMDDVCNNLQRVLQPQSDERLAEPNAVRELEGFVKDRGEEKAVEEIAYTWFNRLCALRFMDMRGYTPVGCVTTRPGSNLPAILADAREGAFAGALKLTQAQKDEVTAILSGAKPSSNPLGDAYVLLLLAACDSYKDAMGYLFSGDLQKRSAMRLLAPSDLLSEQSVMRRICEGMDAEACESVEVLGWLYQFYIAERKKEVFASDEKYSGVEEIGPATQLFTPNWIVRYLVDNSVGRLWMLNNPSSDVRSKMEFFVEPENETEDFIKVYGPEDITVCDPACGSGHILVYAFDLLFEMYLEEGYRSDQIPQLILENNLFGFEIDERAAEIASFALEMKAREKDPGFFEKCVDADITVLEPVEFGEGELKGAGKIIAQRELLDAFEHMDEIGSLYVPADDDLKLIDEAVEKLKVEGGMFAGKAIEKLTKMRKVVDVLGRRYSTVVANPPYMPTSGLNGKTKNWIDAQYPKEKADLCVCFISRGLKLAQTVGYVSMITMQSWMSGPTYESFRHALLTTKSLITLGHLDSHAFEAIGGDVVSTCMFAIVNDLVSVQSVFFDLTIFDSAEKKRAGLLHALNDESCLYRFTPSLASFDCVEGSPVTAYAISPAARYAFESLKTLGEVSAPKVGLQTGKNELYYRAWHEVSLAKTAGFGSGSKWYPCIKGGDTRKWYGNHTTVINWENDGQAIRLESGAVIRNPDWYFKAGLNWTKISKTFAVRYYPEGMIMTDASVFVFPMNGLGVLAFLNSSVVPACIKLISLNLNFTASTIGSLPVPSVEDEEVNRLSKENVDLSRVDWDSFEESWAFACHPLLLERSLSEGNALLVESLFKDWEKECRARFEKVKSNEEAINNIFAIQYGMDDVETEVDGAKISIRLADKEREMRSLVSYGVGCMFGRYSLDEGGLILADQGSTIADYLAKIPAPSFMPDDDNILPILDEEWFEDDIVAGFKSWLRAAYGDNTLDANVAFIEQGLGKDLRSYFVKDFYKDHVKVYQKRPIYWLIQSPKKSFQALVYMHRMDKDTITKVLTDYVQPFRRKLDAQVQVLRATGVNSDAAKADKYQAVIQEMIGWERDVLYPMSQQHIEIDLDDGVKKNYPKFKGAVAKVQGLL